MLALCSSQLGKTTFLKLLLFCLILYNLWQLLQQTQLTFFLGYKILLLFYVGVALIYFDLDILAFILWIVYGSFIVVIFILSFMWFNITLTTASSSLNSRSIFFIAALVIGLFFTLKVIAHTNHWQLLLISSIVNYYELANLQNTEELECLGWGISQDNSSNAIIATILLTIASITAIATVICAKRNKWLSRNFLLKFTKSNLNLYKTTVRTQRLYQQERNNLVRTNRTVKIFHRRRT